MIKAGSRWLCRMMIALVPSAILYGLLIPDFTTVVLMLMVAAVGIALYSILTVYMWPPEPERETRCRKCGYILRGIPEPRCSECGERI